MPRLRRDIYASLDPKFVTPASHILAVLVLGYIILRVIDSALNRLHLIPAGAITVARVKQRTETLRHVIGSVSKGILALIIFLQIGAELGFTLAPVLASAGIVGLAVGFGAQSLVKDVISGFFILFEDQFGIGDAVKIGDFSG